MVAQCHVSGGSRACQVCQVGVRWPFIIGKPRGYARGVALPSKGRGLLSLRVKTAIFEGNSMVAAIFEGNSMVASTDKSGLASCHVI